MYPRSSVPASEVFIGMEFQMELQPERPWFLNVIQVFEHLFMTVYSVELVMRFYCYGIACLRSGWVLFDFVSLGHEYLQDSATKVGQSMTWKFVTFSLFVYV